MTPEEKLKIFREKISNATTFDNNFRQLLGIELFDFIHENTILKNEIYKRFNYLEDLANDKSFKLLQDNLFKTIQKILKLTTLEEVKKWQKELNRREAEKQQKKLDDINVRSIPNNLKTRRNIDINKQKDYLTLPEAYLELQNKDAYYRLGDDSAPFSSTIGEIAKQEISSGVPVLPLINQYEETVENFFEYMFPNINDEKRRLQFNKLIEEYKKYYSKLDELIYRIPIKSHFENFERFFLDCVRFYPREGYKLEYESFNQITLNLINKQEFFTETKENALVVIDDLTDLIKGSPVTKIEIVGGKITTQVEGLEKGLNAIAKTNEEEKKNKFPYKLPAGTEWKNFIIQFFNNKEEVYIQVNRFKHNENYAKMGFADNRFSVPKPNEGWTFLWVLAKYNGELTIKDPDAKDTYKKQKELVSKALKSYFSMESDPFYPYQETKSYKTRFTLLPPPKEFEEKGKKYQIPQTEVEQDSIDEEIRQYFEEQAPQVYDDKRGW